MIEWYSKHGGENNSIDVMVHLKDQMGRVVNDYPKDIQLCTQLVYEDGTDIIPVGTQDNAPKLSNIFRPMRPEPIIEHGTGSVHYAFRIEQVSNNHKPHIGFKLKISVSSTSSIEYNTIVDTLMKETIIVKSRPCCKSTVIKKGNIGGRHTILQKVLGGIPVYLNNNESKLKPIIKKEIMDRNEGTRGSTEALLKHDHDGLAEHSSRNPFESDQSKKLILFHPFDANLFFVCDKGKCLSCEANLRSGLALAPTEHRLDCRLYMTLSQILTVRTRYNKPVITGSNEPGSNEDAKKPVVVVKKEDTSE